MKKYYLYLIKSFMACALLCSAAFTQAQTKTTEQSKPQAQNKGYYTQYYGNQPKLIKKAQQWAESGEWRNGFVQAKPHSSVNLVDFYLQYQKNPAQWKALFEYLSHTDLLAISKGKHKDTRHPVGSECRGFAERSPGKTKERESQPPHRFPVCGKGNGAFRHHRPLHQYAQQQVPTRRDTL